MDLSSIDPSGDGTTFSAPYPQNLDETVYNGSTGCGACGIILNPVQALHSDLCPSCNKRKAAHRVSNKMVG